MTQLLNNKCVIFGQLKCGDSHMTYLARNTVKESMTERPEVWQTANKVQNEKNLTYLLNNLSFQLSIHQIVSTKRQYQQKQWQQKTISNMISNLE
jgi:hypothetical protein